MKDCVFCKIIKGEIPAEKVHEDKDILAFLDNNPNTMGHSLVIPKQHFSNFLETPEEILAKMIGVTKNITPKILKALNAKGFNIGINTGRTAGQVINHVHLHIIPRYDNDGLVHFKAQKTTPEELKKLATKIKKNP